MNQNEYFRMLLHGLNPNLDVRENSPYDELFIAPQAYIGEAFYLSLLFMQQAMLPSTDAENFTSEELEALAKKAFIVRTSKNKSYGIVTLYMTGRISFSLENATFTTSDGHVLKPDNERYVDAMELNENEYGYYINVLCYNEDGINIDANSVGTSSLSGWSRLENEAFAGGTEEMDNETLLELYQNSYIFQDNFLYARSIKNLVQKTYPDVSKIFVAGKSAAELQRDTILDLDTLHGTPGIMQTFPADNMIEFYYRNTIPYDSMIPMSDWLQSNADAIATILSSQELTDISIRNDSASRTFVRGRILDIDHVGGAIYDGGEYGYDSNPSEPSKITTFQNKSMGVSGEALALKNSVLKDSSNSMGAIFDVSDMGSGSISVECSASITLTELKNRFLYIGLTDLADIDLPDDFAYYRNIGVAIKPSETANEYNVFLTNKMETSFSDIVIGDVSMNIGDNLTGDGTPNYTFGRPYLAAGHCDIIEGSSYTVKIAIEKVVDTPNYYNISVDIGGFNLQYSNILYMNLANASRLFITSSEAKNKTDPSLVDTLDVTITDAYIDITNDTGLVIGWRYKFINELSDDYKTIKIKIKSDPLINKVEDLEFYFSAVEIGGGTYTISQITPDTSSDDGQGGFEYTYTAPAGLGQYFAEYDSDTLTLILLTKNKRLPDPPGTQITEYMVDYMSVYLEKVGINGGNKVDVHLSASPTFKQSTVTADSNGYLPFTGLTCPVVRVVAIHKESVPITDFTIIHIPDTIDTTNLRYSTREANYTFLATTGGFVVNEDYVVSYYTNSYVPLVQTMADDDYYKDTLCDVLIKTTIPIVIESLVFSTNAGYTQVELVSKIADYINENPDELITNDLEQLALDDGAKTVNLTSLNYSILYPDECYINNITLSPVPSSITSTGIDSDTVQPEYSRNKGFCALSDNLIITLE